MATFVTTAGKTGNMLLAFSFPETGIDAFINFAALGAIGAFNSLDYPGNGLIVAYAPGMISTGNVPEGGTFTSLRIAFNNTYPTVDGTLSGITRADSFKEIDDLDNYRILDGDDTLNGEALGDTLTGGFGGSDTFNGFAGNDQFRVAGLAGTPVHVFNGGSETDEVIVKGNIYTGATALNLKGSAFSSVEKLTLDPGVTVTLNSSQIWAAGLSLTSGISGGAGSHVIIDMTIGGLLDLRAVPVTGTTVTINGAAGNETIFGSQAAETISGAAGADMLSGGGSADIFDFDDVTHIGKAAGARDRIADFEKGLDRIDLSTIDANGGKPGDTAFKFIKAKDFSEKAGQLHFVKVNKRGTDKDLTRVEGDTDGNGKADFRLELTGLLKLTAADLVL